MTEKSRTGRRTCFGKKKTATKRKRHKKGNGMSLEQSGGGMQRAVAETMLHRICKGTHDRRLAGTFFESVPGKWDFVVESDF